VAVEFGVIGPGRLGTALARRLAEGGYRLLGFVGRSRASAERAVAFCGAGAVLGGFEPLAAASFVLITVRDDTLPDLVRDVAAVNALRPRSLWLHTSGFWGLEVLDPLAALGARTGALHPLCPVPDPESGYEALAGAPATRAAGAGAERFLDEIARVAGLLPLALPADVDRHLYHAACSLAANGATALFDLVEGMFDRECGLGAAAARAAASALVSAAVELSSHHGARHALSGPVLRGDRAVVAAHLRALAGAPAADAYRVLMRHALEIARARGALDEERARAVGEVLGGDG
jgi:predicted short-subunit dehydrogenase-like oxidoreductase (DUF2520 family)